MDIFKNIVWNSAKFWFNLGVICAISACSFCQVLWSGAYYDLVTIAFFAYLRSLYLRTTGNESLWIFIVWLWSLNACIDEFFFNPQTFDVNEYIGALLIVVIVLVNPKKWKR